MKFVRENPVIAGLLMTGGLITFGKHIAGAVRALYAFALVPHGLAAVVVGTAILSAASLIVSLAKR
jgi:hypothetical protein